MSTNYMMIYSMSKRAISPSIMVYQTDVAMCKPSYIFQQYFSYILVISFIGGGNQSTRRKPPTCQKSLTNFIT